MYIKRSISKSKREEMKLCSPMLKNFGMRAFLIMYTSIASWMKPSLNFTGRKTNFRYCIKFLRGLQYSSVAWDYMGLFHSWQFNVQKKLVYGKYWAPPQKISFTCFRKNFHCLSSLLLL